MRIPHAVLRLAVYVTRRKFTAGAVVVGLSPTGRVLLVHQVHGEGHWGFPGGVVNPGESFEDCAARELAEETGLVLAPGQELTLRATYVQERARHIDVVFTLPLADDVALTSENDAFEVHDVRLFGPDELPPLRRESRELLRRLPGVLTP